MDVDATRERVRRLTEDLRTAAAMPRVEVVVSRGAPAEEEVLKAFTRPHPRFRVVGRKVIGVALLPLEDVADSEHYLAGRRYARRRVRRAARLGYTVDVFDPDARRAELHAIRTSLPERQGRPMDSELLDPHATLPVGPHIEYLGVFDADARLVAYTRLEYVGDIVGTMQILGHGEHLANGVMFLLIAGVVDRVKSVRPGVRFVFYDTFFGAHDGLREFKSNAGFNPYIVRWRREDARNAEAVSKGPRARAGETALRLHRDYLHDDRLDDLRRLLRRAVDLGYETMTLSSFAERAARAERDLPERVLLLRHDVDSDVARARRMWEMEQELGLVGSWFFRRDTFDVSLMREIAAGGSEVGYHYEELATVVKERGAADAAEARALIGPARDRLRLALEELRASSGLPLDVVAAHGDFANRFVGVSNEELLADPDVRASMGVRLEAYDVARRGHARAADGAGVAEWSPSHPRDALERGEPVVELLLHPRPWGRAPLVNARADLGRAVDAATYRVRRARRHA